MARSKRNTLHVSLADGRTDKERIDTVTSITKMAPQSPIYTQNPQIHAAVDATALIAGDLKTQGEVARGLQAQLDAAKQVLEHTRIKYGRAIGILRTNLEAVATTVEEVASMGLVGHIGKASPAPLDPPAGVKVVLGKKHGQFRVIVESAERGPFGAEVSPDPIGPATWTDLTGAGKTRVVTGHPTGALVWVRFRQLRGRRASDWCAPVPVTVP